MTGKTDSTGAFTIENVYPADYQVAFDKTTPPDPAKATAMPPPNPLSKYALGASALRAKVAADKTTFDFELKSK